MADILLKLQYVNSMWLSEAIWQDISWSTLAQLMACRLTAPSNCLNQCRLTINGTLRHTLDWNLNQNMQLFIRENAFENVGCKIASILSTFEYNNGILFFAGSNSVNVFLGLGLPWVIKSIYAYINDETVVVNTDNLVSSVVIFSIVGTICIFLLLLRRRVRIRHHDDVINESIFHVTGPLWGNSPVTGGCPSQRPVTRSFDVYFDLRLNKRLSKQSRRRWFETPSCSLWRH